MDYPQITLIILWTAYITVIATKHGKPRIGSHNIWASLVAFGIDAVIIYWGGFFG